MDFIVTENKYEKVVLWGRSMGAVTIIHYLHYLDYHYLVQKFVNKKMKIDDDKLIINFEKLLRYNEKLLVKSKILSDQEKDKINLKRKIIDSVVLDAPFTDSY